MPNLFTKPALRIEDQIALLESRGLVVVDREAAAHCLTYISYYRLRAYWYHFETDPDCSDHSLRPGTTLEKVLSLYDFDRRLRMLVNDGIERIEVAARGSWAYALAIGYGPHGYLNPGLYRNAQQHSRNVEQLDSELLRSHDGFIEHYNNAYGDPARPPVWMVAEVISFGLLSKMISALASRGDRNSIAKPLGLDEKVLTSFLHHLATVRNICAHHGRLWNRRLTVTPILPAMPSSLASSVSADSDRRIYNTLTMMLFILARVAPASDWRQRLLALIGEHPTGDLGAMGFPANWIRRPAWTTAVSL